MNTRILCLFYLLLFGSCSPRNLAYLSDLGEQKEEIKNNAVLIIQPNDLLSISVVSFNPESNDLFNNEINNEGYLVDQEGFIDFPILGRVELEGLSKAEAKSKLTGGLQNYLKDPVINVRYLNFKITVVGEVAKPSTFTIPSDKVNIIEALGLAGDMTPFGKRENILIIREQDGVRNTTRVDLTNKDILNSPYFYLQQNDIVYVEPNNAKAVQGSTRSRDISIALSIVSIITLFITRII